MNVATPLIGRYACSQEGVIGAVVIALLLFGSSPASPQSDKARRDGNWLRPLALGYDEVTRTSGTSDAAAAGQSGQYIGFVLGVSYSLSKGSFCAPDGTTEGQLFAVVSRWLARYPERWHERATDIILTALSEAFPCRR